MSDSRDTELRTGMQPTPDDGVAEQIGPYYLRGVLGEGGMGTVYRAEQREPVRRRVALKLIKLGMDTKQVLARFEAERQALSLMDHPNIAKVLDAGATPEGRPYFAMELVEGVPITDYVDRHALNTHDRLRLFMDVCHGTHHAHQKGIIHRDLKPSNILVQSHDGRPLPKIIDFGVAKATNQQLTERTLWTEQGQIIGTPEYMSPEQAEMSGLGVDTRTDVYSLGVVLYELLTGEPPFRPAELRSAGYAEIQRKLREIEPPKPSTRITTHLDGGGDTSNRRHTDVRTLARELRGDLDWITMKALEKDRTRRYQSASELAADLERHERGLPVEAGPPSSWYRVKKAVVRYRLQIAAGVAVVVALIVGLVVSVIFYFEMRGARDAEAAAKMVAQRNERAAKEVLAWWDLRRAQDAVATLYPAWPQKLPAIRAWLAERAAVLEPLRPSISSAIAGLRERAIRVDGEGPQAWVFDDDYDALLHERLVVLQDDLEEFFAPERGLVAEVRALEEWASTVEQRSVTRYAKRWQAVAERVAVNTRYDALELSPQIGLVPIGPDPRSKLEEFVQLRSGVGARAIPTRDPQSGALHLVPETGIVFVLVPGGPVAIGAQADDPDAPRYDPLARPDEAQILRGRLDAYFIAKHEMTQLQWQRLSGGEEPSFRPGLNIEQKASAPVDQVSWDDCDQLLARHGLVLPTEAQWEHACRAGTDTIWWTGSTTDGLARAANLSDQTAELLSGFAAYEDWADGFPTVAPISMFAPNPFGLHHVHGNVWEWCRDTFSRGAGSTLRVGDGLRVVASPAAYYGTVRIYRGGSYADTSEHARSAARRFNTPGMVGSTVGVRPARPLL